MVERLRVAWAWPRLADDPVEIPRPAPRGVAMAMRLLTDGAGPLYRPWRPEELRGAAERARCAL
jgi:hypothetical protein